MNPQPFIAIIGTGVQMKPTRCACFAGSALERPRRHDTGNLTGNHPLGPNAYE